MMAYRESMRSAVLVAVHAARHAGRLEREVSVGPGLFTSPPVERGTLDWNLSCSQLMASMRNV